jgi:hypothetical protein
MAPGRLLCLPIMGLTKEWTCGLTDTTRQSRSKENRGGPLIYCIMAAVFRDTNIFTPNIMMEPSIPGCTQASPPWAPVMVQPRRVVSGSEADRPPGSLAAGRAVGCPPHLKPGYSLDKDANLG